MYSNNYSLYSAQIKIIYLCLFLLVLASALLPFLF